MKRYFLKKPIIKYSLLAVIIVVTLGFSYYSHIVTQEHLPVYNPADFNPQLVDKDMLEISENHKVSDFELINQNGITITQNDYNNKIYVTDFFFTRCKGICPIMTNNMQTIQEAFIDDNTIKLLSISVTPVEDSISVLREYADLKGAIDTKWNIATGDKKHIYNLARKSYFAAVDRGDGGLQDFIHTRNFVLVDKDKQIRGIYDGTKEDEIQKLIKDIKILKNEYFF